MTKPVQRGLTYLGYFLFVLSLSACRAEKKLPAEERLVFETDSGLQIIGTIYRPVDSDPPWPGVLLLHMIYGQRQDWGEFGRTLAQNGLAALAIDLRGHGETGGEMDWEIARQDLRQVWQAFASKPEIDSNSTAVIGASMGANMAIQLGADRPEIRALVLLSPGLNYYMVQTAEPMSMYGERPLLIVASEEDSYAATSSEELLKYALGEARLEMFKGIGHGTQMLKNQPDLPVMVLEWLHLVFQPDP